MISSEYYPPGSRSSSRASSRARSGLRSQVFFHTRCIWGSTVGEFKLHLWSTNFCLPYGKVSCQQPWSPPWGRQIGGNMDKQEKTILVLVFPSLVFVLLMLFSHKKSLCSRYKSGLLHFMRRKCSLVGGQVEGGSGELGPLKFSVWIPPMFPAAPWDQERILGEGILSSLFGPVRDQSDLRNRGKLISYTML